MSGSATIDGSGTPQTSDGPCGCCAPVVCSACQRCCFSTSSSAHLQWDFSGLTYTGSAPIPPLDTIFPTGDYDLDFFVVSPGVFEYAWAGADFVVTIGSIDYYLVGIIAKLNCSTGGWEFTWNVVGYLTGHDNDDDFIIDLNIFIAGDFGGPTRDDFSLSNCCGFSNNAMTHMGDGGDSDDGGGLAFSFADTTGTARVSVEIEGNQCCKQGDSCIAGTTDCGDGTCFDSP